MRSTVTNPGGFSLVEVLMAVSIVGVLAGLAVQRTDRTTCRARQTEAMGALRAVIAMEQQHRAEKDAYTTIAATCPTTVTTTTSRGNNGNGNGNGRGGAATTTTTTTAPCMVYAAKGRSDYVVTAEVTPTGFTATAIGRSGSTVSGSVWRTDQTGGLVDLSGTCGVAK